MKILMVLLMISQIVVGQAWAFGGGSGSGAENGGIGYFCKKGEFYSDRPATFMMDLFRLDEIGPISSLDLPKLEEKALANAGSLANAQSYALKTREKIAQVLLPFYPKLASYFVQYPKGIFTGFLPPLVNWSIPLPRWRYTGDWGSVTAVDRFGPNSCDLVQVAVYTQADILFVHPGYEASLSPLQYLVLLVHESIYKAYRSVDKSAKIEAVQLLTAHLVTEYYYGVQNCLGVFCGIEADYLYRDLDQLEKTLSENL